MVLNWLVWVICCCLLGLMCVKYCNSVSSWVGVISLCSSFVWVFCSIGLLMLCRLLCVSVVCMFGCIINCLVCNGCVGCFC